MSLGAIDFGLLVDGAVIIVENAARRLAEAQTRAPGPLTLDERVQVVEEATLEVRSASVFGEAIAIVYLPILALVGIEGKDSGRWRRPFCSHWAARSSFR